MTSTSTSCWSEFTEMGTGIGNGWSEQFGFNFVLWVYFNPVCHLYWIRRTTWGNIIKPKGVDRLHCLEILPDGLRANWHGIFSSGCLSFPLSFSLPPQVPSWHQTTWVTAVQRCRSGVIAKAAGISGRIVCESCTCSTATPACVSIPEYNLHIILMFVKKSVNMELFWQICCFLQILLKGLTFTIFYCLWHFLLKQEVGIGPCWSCSNSAFISSKGALIRGFQTSSWSLSNTAHLACFLYQSHPIHLSSSLVATPRPEMDVRQRRHAKCAVLGRLRERVWEPRHYIDQKWQQRHLQC